MDIPNLDDLVRLRLTRHVTAARERRPRATLTESLPAAQPPGTPAQVGRKLLGAHGRHLLASNSETCSNQFSLVW